MDPSRDVRSEVHTRPSGGEMATGDGDQPADEQTRPEGLTSATDPDQTPDPSDLVVVRMDDDDEEGEREAIEHPARLLRLATMAQRIMKEMRDMDIDEAGRQRLAGMYERTLEQLGEVLSDELREELSELVADTVEDDDGPPTCSSALLGGWLEGLFQGIQASLASQQMAAQQQLARLKQQQGQLESGDRRGGSGTYL